MSKHRNYLWGFRCLVILGLIVAASVTISALCWHNAALTGSLSTIVLLLVGLQNALNFEETAYFQLVLHGEAKSLRDRLRYIVTTEEEFRTVFDEFLSLRKRSSEQLPRGQGMGAVRDMYSGGPR